MMGRTLSEPGAAQSRLQGLDDDFYVRGVVAEGRYRSIRVKLEREIDRLHAVVDAGTKQRLMLHPDPAGSGRRPTSNSGGTWFGR